MSFDRNDIREWKEKYGQIFQLDLHGNTYVYRALNIRDCEVIENLSVKSDEIGIHEYIIKNVLLYTSREDLNSAPAGELTFLIEKIYSSAGVFNPTDLNNLLNEIENNLVDKMEDPFFQWKLVIVRHFPGYKFEDIDKLSPYKFFELVKLSEQIADEQFIGNVETNDPINETGNDPTDIDNDSNKIVPVRNNSGSFLNSDELYKIASDSTTRLEEEFGGY